MVWGNFFGKNLLDFGRSRPLPGWFGANLLKLAGKKVPQSARLSAGGGGQKLFGQCPNAFVSNFNGASLTAMVFPGTLDFPAPSPLCQKLGSISRISYSTLALLQFLRYMIAPSPATLVCTEGYLECLLNFGQL